MAFCKNITTNVITKYLTNIMTAFVMMALSLNIANANVLSSIDTVAEPPKKNAIKNVHTELTPEQKLAAEQLTKVAIQIMDISSVIAMVYDENNLFDDKELDDLTKTQKACMADNLLQSQGFYDFKYQQISQYVTSRTSAQLKNEIDILTPEVIDLFSKAFDAGVQIALKQEAGEPVDEMDIMNSDYGNTLTQMLRAGDTSIILGFFEFKHDDDYKELRQVLTIESEKQAEKLVERYIIWGAGKCLLAD